MAGDQQADLRVHGGADKAVYAYAREDYLWWAGELGHPLEPGTFGENLTVEGLDLHGAVIGEQWQVGSAVLAITQPRIPCFKLGVRMGDSGFVEHFAAAGRPGAYLRVVAPGDVEAGDTVGLSARPAHGLTVGDVAAAYAGDGELLETIAENPDVTADWSVWARRQLARRLAKPSSAR
jgi:MOSC domain-containing protein YiiM